MTPTHPIQGPQGSAFGRCGHVWQLPQAVTLQAYEVYRHVYGEQKALVTGGCRGGFGLGEIIAFLYAYPFPREEWRDRVHEAERGMVLGGHR